MKGKLKENKLKIVLIFLILAALVCACAGKSKNTANTTVNSTTNTSGTLNFTQSINSTVAKLLPDKLMGMNKLVALQGERAIEFIKMSHKGPIRYVKDAALLHYIGNGSIMCVWITEYPSEKLAQNQTLAMVKGMKKYGSVWMYVKKIELGNISAYYVPVKNQYFFYEGKYVIYLMPKNMSNKSITMFAEKVYGLLKSLKS